MLKKHEKFFTGNILAPWALKDVRVYILSLK